MVEVKHPIFLRNLNILFSAIEANLAVQCRRKMHVLAQGEGKR